MSAVQLMEYPVYVEVPSDPETSPEAIEAEHRRAVERLVNIRIYDPVSISNMTCLPAWNVLRALHWLKTGMDMEYPKLKSPGKMARNRHQHPIHFEKFKPLKPRNGRCKKNRQPKSLKFPSRTTADGTGKSRKAKR